MNFETELYTRQKERWPATGRHILAQYDDETIVVYQAYRPEIGHFAAANQRFGGAFSYSRMSWIKPNFLWMMYRAGWATKPGQEVVLAVRLRRQGFDEILSRAVQSNFEPAAYSSHEEWKRAVARSDVRLQWDPDHHPRGGKLERRAIQLGLRGEALSKYGGEWIVEIEDVSSFVREQGGHVEAGALGELVTPREKVYPVVEPAVAARLGVEPVSC